MKKTLIIFSCAFSLCFVGCASKSAPVTEKNDIEAPDTNNQYSDISTQEESEIPEEESSKLETETETDNQNEEDSNNVDNSESYEDLEEIEEPVVITIDPPLEDLIDPNDEIESSEELIDPVEVEIPEDTVIETEESETQTEAEIQATESIEDANTSENTDDITISEDETLNSGNDDVIDITDDDASATEIEDEIVIDEIIPSRKVTLKRYEYLDIVYPGNGWVFMGLLDGSKDLTYNGRKLGTGETKFTLQAKNAGTKIIHFYKEDNLTDVTLDDYIEVEILDEKGSNKDHVSAPEYKLPLTTKAKDVIKAVNNLKTEPETEIIKTTESKNQDTPAIQNEIKNITTENQNEEKDSETASPIVVKTSDPNLLLKEAQVLYNNKDYSNAYQKIEEFFELATDKRDEGLYLKGQILEAKSNLQNIKAAIDAYTTLTKNYPSSKYWDDANKRIIYLKRFYLEVR